MKQHIEDLVVSPDNRDQVEDWLKNVLRVGLDFKSDAEVISRRIAPCDRQSFYNALPEDGQSLDQLLGEFKNDVLPYCTNFSSPNFMGFPDSGNSSAAIGGALLADLLQQNLINQDFCAPSGTLVEICVLRWLRETVGYPTVDNVQSVWDAGGIVTHGGTLSNAIAMMLARESFCPNTMTEGVRNPENMKLVVPKGIGHYSVKSAQMWLGCGSNLIEIDTKNFRYDLHKLKEDLIRNKGKIMCVVAYAGDSRTMSIDNLQAVHDITREHAPEAWLHADACHGFSCGFSDKLRHKISGIEQFDSISTDPHKVMALPYTLSALLVKNPNALKLVSSFSDLIMQEQFSFGQMTPFIGSKSWASLKLWFMMKNFGRANLAKLVEHRHELANLFSKKISTSSHFVQLSEVDLNAVAFVYIPNQSLLQSENVQRLNEINQALHKKMTADGHFHVHQFPVSCGHDIAKGQTIYALRLMPGNPLTKEKHLDSFMEYLLRSGHETARSMGEPVDERNHAYLSKNIKPASLKS